MRRTVSLLVTMGALVALGGVAGASQRTEPDPLPAVKAAASVVGSAASALGAVPAVPALPALPSAVEALAPPAPGRELVGAIESVAANLGYTARERTLTFEYPGAEYVKVHFSRLRLLPGDYVTVSDPGGAEVYRYDAGSPLAAGQWAMSVTGDTAEVRLHRAGAGGLADLAGLGITVDKVARGLMPSEAAAAPATAPEPGPGWRGPAPTGREESVCGGDDTRDAICYESSHPTIYANTRPVARLLINGNELCTAFRIGPDNRMLTNQHCLASAADAARTEVWFNYQCTTCGGWNVHRPTKVWAKDVLATDQELDFTLFTVADFTQVEEYGYLELDPRPIRSGERIYIPQHPMGWPTRVAMSSDGEQGGDCVVANPATHGYGWHTDAAYYCDTRGGSSGSPVLSRRTHKVIALHHFGGCPNSGVRMELIARHLR